MFLAQQIREKEMMRQQEKWEDQKIGQYYQEQKSLLDKEESDLREKAKQNK